MRKAASAFRVHDRVCADAGQPGVLLGLGRVGERFFIARGWVKPTLGGNFIVCWGDYQSDLWFTGLSWPSRLDIKIQPEKTMVKMERFRASA